MTLPRLKIDLRRLTSELDRLAEISDCPEPAPAVTRIVFTPTDLVAREFLRKLYQDAGLEVRVDPLGNTFARWQGSQPDLPAVGTGSHTDAIPHAGMYDGTVGVLGGLEAIRALRRSGFVPRRSIELVTFTSEEPTRFGVGCTGSRGMAGTMVAEDYAALCDESGESFDSVRRGAGFTGALADVALPPSYYDAWIELHIEQGPQLEASGKSIGLVTAIAAPATLKMTVHGEGGHAGAVLMPRRRDALAAAAEIVTAVERIALASPSPDLVATVGKLEVHPGAVNSIPSRVGLTLDIRDIDEQNRDLQILLIREAVQALAARRKVRILVEQLNADPPALADPRVLQAARTACQQLGVTYEEMISRAYHDSLFMARIAPISMIFVPSRGGISHQPSEYTAPEHLRCGVEVLALTLKLLSESTHAS
jgi:N-carbamoyl-L-amino-acid hydrolase